QEGVVEVPEGEIDQLAARSQGRVVAGGVHGNHPRRQLERGREMAQELLLELEVGKRLPELHRAVVDVVLGPEAESGLQERQPRIPVVFLRELRVELEKE